MALLHIGCGWRRFRYYYLRIEATQDTAGDVSIAVEDQGFGIPAEFHQRIFDKFFRIENNSAGNRDGLGMGLAVGPSWALYPMVILAAMATVIASQAVISGVFSLTRQAVLLGFAPRVNIIHTSPQESVRFIFQVQTGD